jgi:hypothetical protein
VARISKAKEGDMTREEFRKWAKDNGVKGFGNKNHFKDNFESLCRDYGINYKAFIYESLMDNSEKEEIIIKKEWIELFTVLVKTKDMNPFLNQQEDKSVLNYYKEIDKEIDNLEMNEDTYQIKYSGLYFNLKMEITILEKLEDKLNELKTAISMIGNDARLEFWIHFYKVIDSQLNEICKINEIIKDYDRKELLELLNEKDTKSKLLMLLKVDDKYFSKYENINNLVVGKLKQKMKTFMINCDTEEKYIDGADAFSYKGLISEKKKVEYAIEKEEYKIFEKIREDIQEKMKTEATKHGYNSYEDYINEYKKQLQIDAAKELEERMQKINSIETAEKWTERLIKNGIDDEANILDDSDCEYLNGVLRFIKKVKRKKESFSEYELKNDLINQPIWLKHSRK